MKRRERMLRTNVPQMNLEVRTINDANKLLWERYWGPMNAAAQQLNAALVNTQNLIARTIIEREGLNPDVHLLDVDRMVILTRPNASPIVEQ